MKKYQHIFFDLDRTLWDFDTNSEETISELFIKHGLKEKLKVDFEPFFKEYLAINHECWALYRMGQITKDELRLQRFHNTFREFSYNNPLLALQFNDDYVAVCSSKTNLIEGAIEVLDYLKPNYTLHIITNGFIEAQEVKMKKSGLTNYFDQIIVSDAFGFKKPDKRIFNHAMQLAGAVAENCIMIGDDYGPDVMGANAVGMDQIYFTKVREEDEPATHIISSLIELKSIL